MSIRIRNVPAGTIAVCAARSVPLPGDIYLDDAAHHALSLKFALDFEAMGFLPARDHSAPPDAGVEDRRPLIAAMEEAESNNPNRASWDKEYAAPTLPPVGERPIPRYDERAFEENGKLGVHFRLDPNGDWVRYADVAALLATRPSPAPSGEPVRFEYRFKREPDHDWTLWGGRMEAGHFSRDQRDAIANQYRQEGYVVETRDLYAASPAPSGERPVMAMVTRNGGWSVMWDEPEPPALEALPDGHYNLYLAAAPHPDGQGVG